MDTMLVAGGLFAVVTLAVLVSTSRRQRNGDSGGWAGGGSGGGNCDSGSDGGGCDGGGGGD